MAQKIKGKKIVEFVYNKNDDTLTCLFNAKHSEFLPLCTARLLAILVADVMEKGGTPKDVTKICDYVFREAWNMSNVKIDVSEVIGDEEDPRNSHSDN